MEAVKKEREYDIVVTMSSKEAKILCDAFGKKSGIDDEEYYGKGVHEVIYDLFRVIDNEVN